MSGWTTPSVSPAATPASIALPPAAKAQRVPITCTVAVGAWTGARCCEETESRLMTGLHHTREPRWYDRRERERNMQARTFWKVVTLDRADFLDRLIALLNEHRIRFCVVGGQAVNAYAEPVVSLDLDLAVAVDQLAQTEAL